MVSEPEQKQACVKIATIDRSCDAILATRGMNVIRFVGFISTLSSSWMSGNAGPLATRNGRLLCVALRS